MKPARISVCPGPDCQGWYKPSNVPPGHPLYDQWVPCACTLARRTEAIKGQLGQRYRAMTFETFQCGNGNREAADLARKFAADPWGQGWYWLVLVGANGRGKTHLAVAVINALLERGEPAYLEEIPALLDWLRAGYGRQADDFDRRLAQVKDVPVLVLDDLGAEARGQQGPMDVTWAQDKLYQVLNHRLVEQLPTVITTNVPLDALPPRISSRLQDKQVARVKAIIGADYRRGN